MILSFKANPVSAHVVLSTIEVAPVMDIPRELIDQFIHFTNAAEPLANQLLLDNNLNVEAAVSSFFAIQEASGGVIPAPEAPSVPANPATSTSQPSGSNDQMDMDAALAAALAESEGDNVRAPIPQRVETLLPDHPMRRSQAVVDPFIEDGGESSNRFGELFRPPSRLIFNGSLDEAFSLGMRRKCWVLVTLHQPDVFACQVLTRDVWNDPEIQELLETYYVFWQRDSSSDDGARYRHFYPFSDLPHIAVLDPRSGERVFSLSPPNGSFARDDVLRNLTDFITANSLESSAPVRRPMSTEPVRASSSASAPLSAMAAASSSVRANDDIADTEEAQLAAAIAASMEMMPAGASASASTSGNETPGAAPNEPSVPGQDNAALSRAVSRQLSASNAMLNRDRSLRAQQDLEYRASLELDRAKEESARAEEARVKRAHEIRDAKRQRVPPEPPAGAPNVAELVVRLPSNARLKRRFLVSHTIGDVYDFVETEAEEAADVEFELMTPFPKERFADRSQSIGDAGLSPKALLVVHVR